MGKILILLLIILVSFWVGRLSVGAKKEKITKKASRQDPSIIDIELEDKP